MEQSSIDIWMEVEQLWSRAPWISKVDTDLCTLLIDQLSPQHNTYPSYCLYYNPPLQPPLCQSASPACLSAYLPTCLSAVSTPSSTFAQLPPNCFLPLHFTAPLIAAIWVLGLQLPAHFPKRTLRFFLLHSDRAIYNHCYCRDDK